MSVERQRCAVCGAAIEPGAAVWRWTQRATVGGVDGYLHRAGAACCSEACAVADSLRVSWEREMRDSVDSPGRIG